jgi:hypothetical protein
MSTAFSPFNLALNELTAEALVSLRSVREGWFVEYKRQALTPAILGKHLSAFANHHGGWLILGIEENKQTATADAFPGIRREDVVPALTALREGAASHVSPPVYFETKIVYGPSLEIALPEHRAIVIVYIPESADTPHIHSSGKIYRRFADQSAPKHETDRAVLDELYGRRNRAQARLACFLTQHPHRSGPTAHLYLFSDPLLTDRVHLLTRQQIINALAEPADGFGLPLNNIFPTTDGFIARQIIPRSPSVDALAFRWYAGGNARVSIPLNTFVVSPPQPHYSALHNEFIFRLESQRLHHAIGLDCSRLIGTMAASTQLFIRLRRVIGLDPPYYGKIRLTNIQGKVPFINVPSYMKTINDYGLPLLEEDEALVPVGLTKDSLLELPLHDTGQAACDAIMNVFALAIKTLRALGIYLNLLESEDDLNAEVSEEGIRSLVAAVLETVTFNNKITPAPAD